MIEWMSSWAEQIIVAVIIATIIEMLLPSGNNKKYIKAVIGVYILFTIVSPILGKVTNLDFSNMDYDKYLKETDTYQTMSEVLTSKNDQSVEEIYIANLKQDMTQKLKEKGYLAKKITVKLDLEEGDNYGRVNAIYLTVETIKEEKEEDKESKITNQITINTVEKVAIGNTVKNEEEVQTDKIEKLSSSQIKEIKNYLSSVYEVKQKNIEVNGK